MDAESIKKALDNQFVFKKPGSVAFSRESAIGFLLDQLATLTRKNDELNVLREERPNLLKAVHESEHKIATLTRERETLCTISTGVSAANDGLKKEIAILTRANADLAARVGELQKTGREVLDRLNKWVPNPHPNYRCTADRKIWQKILSIPTPGSADRLRIEGMEIAAKIASEWKREIVLSDCCDVAQDDACIGITDTIRSRIAEMEKGE